MAAEPLGGTKNKMAHPTSSLLASYRNAADCAGQHRKIGQSQGGVAAALMDHTNQYGPSHAAFSQWKRSGIPTAEVRSRVNALSDYNTHAHTARLEAAPALVLTLSPLPNSFHTHR